MILSFGKGYGELTEIFNSKSFFPIWKINSNA